MYFGNKVNVIGERIDEEYEVTETLETFCKNLILCGPPVNGKSYNTINYAVAIIEDIPLAFVAAEDYSKELDRYIKYKES